MSNKAIQNIFYLSGFINIVGTIVLSKFFTNQALIDADPIVMSSFGLILITVWGLAFLAVGSNFQNNKWIIGVFAIEKISYVIAWCIWFANNELMPLFEQDIFAGIFYSVYGLNDFLFFVFFMYVFFIVQKTNR